MPLQRRAAVQGQRPGQHAVVGNLPGAADALVAPHHEIRQVLARRHAHLAEPTVFPVFKHIVQQKWVAVGGNKEIDFFFS